MNPRKGRLILAERGLARIALVLFAAAITMVFVSTKDSWAEGEKGGKSTASERQTDANAQRMLDEGKQTFRFDTFGDEAFWTDALQLHRAIAGAANGGVGPGVSPATALAVGLKVDSDALPQSLVSQLKHGRVNLDDPATTLALLKLNAVVGVKGTFKADGTLQSVGITCALCHSTVDNSFAPGIGQRLDGWAARDLNVGAIVALSPNLTPVATLLGVDVPTVKTVLHSWGPGKFDAELFLDGKAFRPDGKSAATLIPPAFGLVGVNLHTWTGWGSVTHWNAFVANLEMHGQGTFYDPRLNDPVKFPIAAREGFGNVRSNPDLISPKLPALHFYQLAIPAPAAPAGSFDPAAAARGAALFNGQAKCAVCHVPPTFTEPGWNMHTAEEIGIDDFQAKRSPDERYRTSPLKGLWTHQKGGFYHDGRFATLRDVIEHYNSFLGTNLTDQQKVDLVEYLKSL
jgi:cytochrome c5